jgi:hypothetical protein
LYYNRTIALIDTSFHITNTQLIFFIRPFPVGDKEASPTHRKEYSIVAGKLLQATNVKRYTKQLRAQRPRYFYSTKHCTCDLHLREGAGDGKGEDKAKEDRWLCFGKSRSVIW